MARRLRLLVAGGLIFAAGVLASPQLTQGQGRAPSTVTPADYQRWKAEFKNWGRWGPNDQLGTTNLITVAKVISAARLVRSGIVISLAHPEPQTAEADVQPAGIF